MIRGLSQKQAAFVDYYAAVSTETYRNATASAIAAGYTKRSASGIGCNLLKLPKVQRAIVDIERAEKQRIEAQSLWKIEFVRSEHLRLMREAEGKGDLAVATRNLELIGKTIGAYTETGRVDLAKVREFSDRERVEIQRITRILITHKTTVAQGSAPSESKVVESREVLALPPSVAGQAESAESKPAEVA